MTADATTTPNADQVAYWNGDNGTKWARLQARLDALFVPISEAAVAAAAAKPGEAVLDIGCGCGATVLALAAAVGPGGSVTGVDISAPMLEVARRRLIEADAAHVDVVLADAATEPFPAGTVDLVFSRFGVMFFDAPAEAFTNIRRALKPGGRLLFACWRPFKGNPWFHVPYKAAVPHLPEQEKPDPEAPGPFSFAEPARVERILGLAGFSEIDVKPFDAMLTLGGPGDVADALNLATEVGPAARALGTGSPEQRATAERAIAEALKALDGAEGIRLGAQCWFVSARA